MTATISNNILCITVRNEGEYGTFFVQEYKVDDYFQCQLTIHSSFGCYGYFWSSMGKPAKDFFSQLNCSYLMGKLFGGNEMIFDFDKTILELKKMLLREVRAGEHQPEDARDLYNALAEFPRCDTEAEFATTYYETLNPSTDEDILTQWCNPTDIPWQRVICPAAKGIWDLLWPEFVTMLKKHRRQAWPFT